MTSHTSTEYDLELAGVRAMVVGMGGHVERQLLDAVECVGSASGVLIDEVLGHETVINGLERAIDERCSQIIARRQPAAGDLRQLLAFIKVTTDLERVGDEVKKIALQARKVASDGAGMRLPRYVDVRQMAREARAMLRSALEALARMSVEGTAAVVRRDEAVNEAFRVILRRLVDFMVDDPRTIGPCLDIVFVAKALERVGDHAKNIAEHVIYAVKAQDVRHASLDAVERAARTPD